MSEPKPSFHPSPSRAALRLPPFAGNSNELAALLVRDTAKWARIIREKKIKGE